MNRREFTKAITLFIQEMISAGEEPIADYLLRSAEEQRRLYMFGREIKDGNIVIVDKSKVLTYKDGYKNKSEHQEGKALDIYLWNKEKQNIDFEWQKEKADKWHKIWVEKYGGKSLWLEKGFDAPHFQG